MKPTPIRYYQTYSKKTKRNIKNITIVSGNAKCDWEVAIITEFLLLTLT